MKTAVIKEHIIRLEQPHVRSIAWSPESPDVLALGSRDGVVHIINLVHGAIQCIFTTSSPVHALAWSPAAEHTVEIWTVATGRKRLRYYGHQAGVYRCLTEEVQALA